LLSLPFAVFLAVHGRMEEAASVLVDIIDAGKSRDYEPEMSASTQSMILLLTQFTKVKADQKSDDVLSGVQEALALSSNNCAVLTKAAELLALRGVNQEADRLFLGMVARW